jgi:hypothetical protein
MQFRVIGKETSLLSHQILKEGKVDGNFWKGFSEPAWKPTRKFSGDQGQFTRKGTTENDQQIEAMLVSPNMLSLSLHELLTTFVARKKPLVFGFG